MPMPRPGTDVKMFGDSENGYVAVNPATGKLERVVEGYDMNAGDGGWWTYYFESDPDKPADAQYRKFPNSYSSWDKFTETAVPVGLAAIATMGMGAGAAGAGAGEAGAAAGGMSAADAATLGAMTEGAGAAGAGTAGAGATGLGGVTGAAGAGGFAMPAAVPESASTLASWGMTETAPGVWQAAASATGGGTALSRLLNGSATTEDYLELAGRAAPGLLGAYGANKQANAYSDLGEKYLSIGAPSRARFESSFAPGFSMENEPGFKDALALTTKETLHQLSPGGNPAGSPNAWQKTLDDVNAKFAYPALQDYRRVNAGAGGLAALTSAAPGAESSAINANKGVYDALGAGAADIFSPPRNLSDLLREFKRAVA